MKLNKTEAALMELLGTQDLIELTCIEGSRIDKAVKRLERKRRLNIVKRSNQVTTSHGYNGYTFHWIYKLKLCKEP